MQVLNYFYTQNLNISNYHPRKLQLPQNQSFLLTGARGVGKSAIISNYLTQYPKKNYLYIDCLDPIFILEEFNFNNLNHFLQEEQIKLLVLDSYYKGFLEKMPNVKNIIIISNEPIDIFNLPIIKLYPLDFEEFINFGKSNAITTAFNLYAKKGSLPKIANSINTNSSSKELFYEKFTEQEGRVLLILAIFNTKIATPHQIFQRAKDYFKISKDWIYKTIKMFEKEGIIYTIDTYEKGFGKKIILYDFAFAKYLNKHQTFLTTLDTIIALALLKHKIEAKALINPLGYILNNQELILVSPFLDKESSWSKIENNIDIYIKLKPSKVTIITVSNNYSFKLKNITFNAMPFTQWVMGLS